MSHYSILHAKKFTPYRENVFVTDMEGVGNQKTQGGIIVLDDNLKERGIKPRWGRVWAVGPEADPDITVGSWVLLTHAMWQPRIELHLNDEIIFIWRISPEGALMTCDEDPRELSHKIL